MKLFVIFLSALVFTCALAFVPGVTVASRIWTSCTAGFLMVAGLARPRRGKVIDGLFEIERPAGRPTRTIYIEGENVYLRKSRGGQVVYYKFGQWKRATTK